MNNMADLESRFQAIENRLSAIESGLDIPPAKIGIEQAGPAAALPRRGRHKLFSITSVLGWSGSSALVLAFVSLIRLALDNGWLSPERQIGLAVIGGVLLIAAGLSLRNYDIRYAAFLPAGGVVTIFLAIYGARAQSGLIGTEAAMAWMIVVSAISLWIGRLFVSDFFALLAAVGTFSIPLLIPNSFGTPTDVIIFFTISSILYSSYAVLIGQRLHYLLALYFSLLSFKYLAGTLVGLDWQASSLFYLAQLIIFSIAAAAYSIRHMEPITEEAALAHLPALLIFYSLEYSILKQNLPEFAAWIVIIAAVALIGLYVIVKERLHKILPGGRFLVSTFAALVLLHAGYFESTPEAWSPWVALVAVLGTVFFCKHQKVVLSWPIWLAVGIVVVDNFFSIVTQTYSSDVVAAQALPFGYSLTFYLAFYALRGTKGTGAEMADAYSTVGILHVALLYAGHIAAMAAFVHMYGNQFPSTILWAILGIGSLILSVKSNLRILGQSSLLIFIASCIKVLLFDLYDSAPVIRIGSFIVLGGALYMGGWLYKKNGAIFLEYRD